MASGLLPLVVCSWRGGSDRSPRMLASLVGAAVLALVGLACAHPDADTFDTVDVSKRDLEFNQYVPGYRLRGEPSCEELREMWRLSKREARRATTTNQLPRNRPYTYGRLVAFAPDPNARPTTNVYGSTWHYPPAKSAPSNSPYKDRFEDLRRMLGMAGDRRGNYDKLQQKVAAMRGPGRSSKGKYDELRRIVTLERQEPRPVALSLSAPKEAFQRSSKTRREPAAMSPRTMRGSTHFSQQGFVGPLLPADSRGSSFTPWQPPAPDPAVRSCSEVRRSYCRVDSDCACAGLYRCNKGRCKVSAKQPVVEDSMGGWYNGPVEQEDLGVWSLR